MNFAETLLNGIQIEGKIETVFNHKRFIAGLKKFQLVHKSSWKGFFTYEDAKDNFIFKAPDFIKELVTFSKELLYMNNIAWVVVLIGVIVLCYGVYMLLKVSIRIMINYNNY